MTRQFTPRPNARTGLYLACAHCGRQFYRPRNDTDRRFCSRTCRDAGMRATGVEKVCDVCGTTYVAYGNMLSRQRYCSRKCRDAGHYQRRMERFAAESPHRGVYAGQLTKRRLRQTVTACQECGWDAEPAILELHHRDGDRGHNTPENLRLLCPNCHTLGHFQAGDGQFTNNLGRRRKND